MTKLILAISPEHGLLDQISAHLQEGGRFQVFGVTTGKEALALAGKQNFDIAILDSEANDLPFLPLTRELIALIPSLKLLIFPPNNNVHHPILNGVVANGYLNKPFFAPEVNEKIARALNENASMPGLINSEENPARMWVENPESGLHQLEQLLASTSASSGLLLIHGRVIAASGALGDESSQNVVNFLTRYWTNIQSGELFRYLQMDNETKNYLVYTTPIFNDVALALIYHTNISLIKIRGEVTSIRNALLSRYANTSALRSEFLPAGQDAESNEPAPLVTSVAESQAEEATPTVTSPQAAETAETADEEDSEEFSEESNEEGLSETELGRLDSIMGKMQIPEPESGEEEQPGLSETELANLDSLLASMPAPDPDAEEIEPAISPVPSGEWVNSTLNEAAPEALESIEIPAEEPQGKTKPLSHFEPPAAAESETVPLPTSAESTQPVAENFPDFDFLLPWEKDQPAEEEAPIMPPPLPVMPQAVPVADSLSTAQASAILFEYQFLLVPANPQQFITHDLANLLNRQLPRLHQSNGWQCTHLSIRPLYMQWSARLPMNTCLPEMIAEIKELSEIQIFAASPALLRSHPDGKFWAAGYFSVSGPQPLSAHLINDTLSFFRQTLPEPQAG